MPDVRDQAPDFTLFRGKGETVTLSELRGQKVVLAFFPAAFTGVCEKELCTFRDSFADLAALNATVLGISVDGLFANLAFAHQDEFGFVELNLLASFGAQIGHNRIKTFSVCRGEFGVEGVAVEVEFLQMLKLGKGGW